MQPSVSHFRTGSRVYLRAVEEGDLPRLTAWMNDSEVTQYLTVSTPLSTADERRWYERLSEKPNDVIFAIVLKDSDELIGTMGLHKIDWINGTATTGSVIGRKDLWGNGYGTEAKMLVLDYAFNTLNLRKICSEVYDFNTRSAAALAKCGYKQDGGPRKAHVYRNGRYADLHVFAVFKEDFIPIWESFSEKTA